MKNVFPLFLLSIYLLACESSPKSLLVLLDPEDTGITFNNQLVETAELNILNFSYFYNGGGVSVGDFDNNGLTDIFFTGNMVENQLYLNQGQMTFKDVTQTAGVGSPDKWMYGSTTIDINQDGWLDLYVCASIAGKEELRRNMLFVNQGLNEQGIPTFEDQARAYGIDDSGYSSQAAFFDYDKDGDLDLFILSNSKVEGIPSVYKAKVNDGSSDNTDRLYRNNGNGTFTNVSSESGILKEGFGLGVAIMDANKDGASDIYVGNDYITNDLLYMNDGQGSFVDKIDEAIQHQSRFSMGNDAADINNDGHLDIITLDMLPESNMRKKTVIIKNGYIVYINDNRFGYTHQYVRNMLQLNNGNMTFSEIGQLAGVHQTEWSWSPLFADIDNDGFKDLLITNGFPKDITDNDFISFRQKAGAYASKQDLLEQIPSLKIPNYAFKNQGDLRFEDVSEAWGFIQPSFSNGAAFADFDNDGDLDYVVNNINDPAFLYENTLYHRKQKTAHFLRIKLIGPQGNTAALGTKVEIKYGDDQLQYHEHTLYRGYVSTVEDMVHFGMGKDTLIDQLRITWPDGNMTIRSNVKVDQVLEINYDSSNFQQPYAEPPHQPLVTNLTSSLEIAYVHQEIDFIDYNIQRNIPHKFSQYGPSIAVGDINGDGRDDAYLGGSRKYEGAIFLQQADGTFNSSGGMRNEEKEGEDVGSLLFDADGDGDQDLYLVRGSSEYPEDSEFFQDQLLLNDGRGNFRLSENALPPLKTSGSCVRAADYDRDGDLDLFVGGRVVVGSYPLSPRSYILNNNGGIFSDVTQEVCANLSNIGMVTDAIWSDFTGDGQVDLIVVGEFMPIQFFANEEGQLSLQTATGITHLTGWWNSIIAADMDKDGDMDYIAGNLGENNFYCASPTQPLQVTAKDFDANGAMDAVLSCYLKAEDGSMKPFPIHSWQELNAQSPMFRARFQKYEEYGRTTIDELFTPEQMEGALIKEATHLSSSYIENLGDGTFSIHPLPLEAQFAPINGMLALDLNGDRNLDLLMIGNDYGNEVNMGQYDALTGLVLLGDGQGAFMSSRSDQTGFVVNGDAKALALLSGPDGVQRILATQNRGPMKVFGMTTEADHRLPVGTMDHMAIVYYEDGSIERHELHYGSGFLSQSSRTIPIHENVDKIELIDFAGNKRSLPLPSILHVSR